MTGQYSISVDPERNLMRIRLEGFFDIDTIHAFDRDRRPLFAQFTCGPNRHLSLCDISGCNLQSQDAVLAFKAVMSDRSLFSRRLAFVTGSSLARMQARRIMERDSVSCFETEEAAMAWLYEPETAATA